MNDTVIASDKDVVSMARGHRAAGYLPFAGRLMIAAIFLLSGLAKLAAPTATIGYITAAGMPLPTLAYVGAIALEVGGAVALIIGFQTRAVAIIFAGYSILTALAFHHALGDQNQLIHFFKNVAMAGGLLQVAAFGPGRIALDHH